MDTNKEEKDIEEQNIENQDVAEQNIDEIYDDVEKDLAEEDSAEEDTNQVENTDGKAKKKMNPVLAEALSWVKMIAIAFILAVVIDNFVIVNATVPTGSMENTIATGSRMIGLRFSYLFSDPKRGDIVIFKNPLNEDEPYVKRIIGLPNERVEIKNATITIYKNGEDEGEVLEEDYLKEKWTVMTGDYNFDIPDDCYLMLGDNRNNSSDARRWIDLVAAHNSSNPNDKWDDDIIYVRRKKILGKAVLVYWPFSEAKILKNK